MACAAAWDSTKPMGFDLFLKQVRNQTRRAREQRYALQRAERKARIKQHRGNRGRDIHHQRLARDCRQHRFDVLRGTSMRIRRPGLAWRPGTGAWRADPRPCAADGHSRAPASSRAQYSPTTAWRRGFQTRHPAARNHISEQLAGILRRAKDHRAAAEKSGSHCALQCFRRGGVGHAAGLHAGHEAMLGDRHQRGIEHAALGGLRHFAGQQKPQVVRETHLRRSAPGRGPCRGRRWCPHWMWKAPSCDAPGDRSSFWTPRIDRRSDVFWFFEYPRRLPFPVNCRRK